MNCLAPQNVYAHFFTPEKLEAFCSQTLLSPVLGSDVGLIEYLPYFLVTLLLEAPFFFWVMSSWRLRWQALLAANLATHPLVVLALPHLLEGSGLNFAEYAALSECFVVLVEAAVLSRLLKGSLLKLFAIALLANAFSWMLGSWIL